MTAPLFETLASALRERIATNKLTPGQRLPSEAQLSAEHQLSRATTREALKLLEREGLLISFQGRGWYVRESNPLLWHASRSNRGTAGTGPSPNDAWAIDVRNQDRDPGERIEVAVLPADARIAERLHLETGAYVVVRRRLRLVDGEISHSADTYYPHEVVMGSPIAEPGDIQPGVFKVMDELGYRSARWRDEVVARASTAAEADRLGLRSGDAVAEIVRTRYRQDGRPVSVTVTATPGDRMIVVYEGEET